MWNIRSIEVIPVVVGVFGSTLKKKLKKCIEELVPKTEQVRKNVKV